MMPSSAQGITNLHIFVIVVADKVCDAWRTISSDQFNWVYSQFTSLLIYLLI